MVDACLRGIDFLEREVAAIDRALADLVLASSKLRRLITLPGVNFVTACALLAAIGDVRRFPTARHLVRYLGLDPSVRQSGSEPGILISIANWTHRATSAMLSQYRPTTTLQIAASDFVSFEGVPDLRRAACASARAAARGLGAGTAHERRDNRLSES